MEVLKRNDAAEIETGLTKAQIKIVQNPDLKIHAQWVRTYISNDIGRYMSDNDVISRSFE